MSQPRVNPSEYSDLDELFARVEALERRNATRGLGSPSGLSVAGVGVAGAKRAGRKLTVADFTQLLGVAAPIALYNLDTFNDSSGNGYNLTNTTAAVLNGTGVTGVANDAARFTGNANAALFRADASGGPFNIRTGTFGCWFKTGKKGVSQRLMAKGANVNGSRSWLLSTDPSDSLKVVISTDGSAQAALVNSQTPVCDDRWHFGVVTCDSVVVRIIVDGQLDIQAKYSGGGGALFQGAMPFNIGNAGVSAVAGTGTESLPSFGLIDEAFVHPEVLSEDQIRLLMAASIAHGQGSMPSSVSCSVRRRRRGGRLVPANFPATPRRIYNLGSDVVGDEGADNAGPLTAAGTLPYVDGIDGATNGAKFFPGVGGNYAVAAAPAAFTAQAKTVGCWFQTQGTGAQMSVLVLANQSGASGATDWRPLYIQANGVPAMWDGTASGADGGIAGNVANVLDGLPHFWVVVLDNAASDGLKRKVYLDSRMVGSDTSFPAVSLGTNGGFYLGQLGFGNGEPYKGILDGVFVCDYAMTAEQIATLFAVGSRELPSVVFDNSIIEAADATNLYLLADRIDPQHLLDIGVAA